MKYYKIIIDSNIIGVGTTSELRSIQTRRSLLMGCIEKDAECIQIDDNFYHAGWMKRIDEIETQFAEVVQIDEEEYNLLKSALEEEDEDVLETYLEPEVEELSEPTEEDILDANTLELVRESKIAEMNKTCYKTIISGFEIVLSDNNSHHFSLELTDQLNIEKLYLKAIIGLPVNQVNTSLPYHADNEEFKFYSSEDIIAIYNMMEHTVDYNTAYFNSLKTYIKSLDTIQEIGDIYYGIEIPEEHQSEVFKLMVKQ